MEDDHPRRTDALRPFALVAGLLLRVAAFAGVGIPESAQSQSAPEEEDARSITVSRTDVVRTVPDRASFWFGVQTEGRTAAAAMAANEAEMRRVVAALRSAGVAAADIQTQNVSLSPRMTETGTEIVGYTATNNVSAQIRDLDRAGAVIDAAVNAGANQVNGPSLFRADQTAQYRQALRAAYADARAKAQSLAETMDVSLGRVVNATEASSSVPLPAAGRDSAASVTIEPARRTCRRWSPSRSRTGENVGAPGDPGAPTADQSTNDEIQFSAIGMSTRWFSDVILPHRRFRYPMR